MPYHTRKVRGKNCYRVSNKNNKRVFSKCTSLTNAKKQTRLLNALHYNKNFVSNGKTRRNRS